jgi:hypothetical protein
MVTSRGQTYTVDEKKEMSEIVKAVNERHSTQFSEADIILETAADR